MAQINREDYVARSFLYFLTAMILSVGTLLVGGCYLALNYNYIDFPKAALKLGATETILVLATYVCWRSYLADRQLLTSSENKHMNTKSSNIDTQGINFPDF